MSALRKPADSATTAPREDATPVERVETADYQSPRTADGELPTSPAILLQEQLAARVAGSARVAQVQGRGDAREAGKWPMPLRIATIVGLSVALWGGIVITAIAVIT